jgi:hypothetical protein
MSQSKRVVVALAFVLLAASTKVAAQTAIAACGPIIASGSYKLSNNLTAAGDCLVVATGATANVTIDLNGFTILGNGTGSGIVGGNVFEGVTVRNGTVKNFDVGLNLYGNTILIERVTLIRNVSYGLIAVESVVFRDNLVVGNGIGLSVGEGSVLTDNTVGFNTSDGMQAGEGSTIVNNSSRRNGGVGLAITCASNVIGNTATGNTLGNLVSSGLGCNNFNNVAP